MKSQEPIDSANLLVYFNDIQNFLASDSIIYKQKISAKVQSALPGPSQGEIIVSGLISQLVVSPNHHSFPFGQDGQPYSSSF